MELALVIFSAITAVSTAILAFLLSQIQKNLNQSNKKQANFQTAIYNQLERLSTENQAIERKISELINGQDKSIDKIHEALRGSGEIQIGKLQIVADKLEELKNSLEESIKF